MIKFKVDMENDQDSSSIYSISGTTPTAQIDERDKKKFLKVILTFTFTPSYSKN